MTLNYWANYYIAQWDIYAQANPLKLEILENDMQNSIPLFKSERREDYQRFRSLMQVADLLTLELQSFKFEKRSLIAAIIYIELGTFYEIIDRNEVASV